MPARARVLVVAGSDSGGGAGIQADIKTVTALGGFAATAVTALTAQNTEGVFAIHDVPADFVARQMEVVLDDIGADAIKTGMVHRPDVIEVVGAICRRRPEGAALIVDPVMVAKGGAALLAPEADRALIEALIAQQSPGAFPDRRGARSLRRHKDLQQRTLGFEGADLGSQASFAELAGQLVGKLPGNRDLQYLPAGQPGPLGAVP